MPYIKTEKLMKSKIKYEHTHIEQNSTTHQAVNMEMLYQQISSSLNGKIFILSYISTNSTRRLSLRPFSL